MLLSLEKYVRISHILTEINEFVSQESEAP